MSITRITTIIALLLAAVLAVVIPAGYFAAGYENLAGRLEAETEINGRLTTQIINENPELWRYETFRLGELLSRRPRTARPEIRRVLDLDGREVVAHGAKLPPPLLTRSSVVLENGHPAARIEIVASYRDVVIESIFVAAAGLLLGFALFVTMRVLPLKAVSQAEDALREANDFFSKVMQSSTNGIFVLDAELCVMMVNRRGCELLGCEEGGMLGRPFSELVPESKNFRVQEPLLKLLEGHEATMVRFDTEVCCHLPTPTVISCGAAPVLRNDAVSSIVVSVEDITERKIAEEHIMHMAYYDALTGLPNRTFFSDQVECTLGLASRTTGKAAILLVDLDNFKRINDTLGHRIGDQVLRIASERLKNSLRRSDLIHRPGADDGVEMVARFGGDEFTILLSLIKDDRDSSMVAERILEAFAEPMALDEHEVFVTMSIGISIYPKDGTTLDQLLKNADTAMYKAKFGGKNGYEFYRRSMNEKALERLTLENALYKAVEQNDFTVHYQPKLHIRSGEVTGFEALLRWCHPEIGMISPQEFIPIAEESGLIVPITQWVVEEGCRQAKLWQEEGICALPVAVNISTHLFKQKDMVQLVRDTLERNDLEPRFLELEITESVMLHDTNHTIGVLKRLQQMGVDISIDDFGTGYSSFSYLKNLPVNAIKIDRTFVEDISKNREDVAIVKAIIATAQSLGLKVIAEGVETTEQLHFLTVQNCDEVQGYLLSRPLQPDAVPAFLAQHDLQMAG